ncbi:MAG: ribonuclease H-like domain-containing protein [Flavobacterium sp.]|nr:ribonuclease H-like domain-containing protein [Flavobacterium sp.]
MKPKKKQKKSNFYKSPTQLFDKSVIDFKHKNSNLVCYTDGSGDNMDKSLPIEFSFVIYENNSVIHKNKNICKDKENTTVKAEILGINMCLAFLIAENLKNEKITIFSDAKWVVDWVCNKLTWESKNTEAHYYKAYLDVRRLIPQFRDIEFIWIPRDYNTVADGMLRY